MSQLSRLGMSNHKQEQSAGEAKPKTEELPAKLKEWYCDLRILPRLFSYYYIFSDHRLSSSNFALTKGFLSDHLFMFQETRLIARLPCRLA
jgi:hypothetical protein